MNWKMSVAPPVDNRRDKLCALVRKHAPSHATRAVITTDTNFNDEGYTLGSCNLTYYIAGEAVPPAKWEEWIAEGQHDAFSLVDGLFFDVDDYGGCGRASSDCTLEFELETPDV